MRSICIRNFYNFKGKLHCNVLLYLPFTVTSTLAVRIGDDSVAVLTRHSYLPLAPLFPTTVSMLWATHNPEYEK